MSFFKFGKKSKSKESVSGAQTRPGGGSAGKVKQTPVQGQQQQQQQQSRLTTQQQKTTPPTTTGNSKISHNDTNGINPAHDFRSLPSDGKKARNLSISRSGRHKERRQRLSVLQNEVYSDPVPGADSNNAGRPRLTIAGPPTAV